MDDETRSSERVDDKTRSQQLGEKLYKASHIGSVEDVHHYIKLGANLNWKDGGDGWTPLMIACYNNNTHVQKILLDHQANPNMQNDFGNTALHRACDYGKLESVKLLTHLGADLGIKNVHGDTPLDKARQYGHSQVVDFIEKFHKGKTNCASTGLRGKVSGNLTKSPHEENPNRNKGGLTIAELQRTTGLKQSQLEKKINGHEYKLGGCFDTADSCYLDKFGLSAAQQTDVNDIAFRRGIQTAMEKALKDWQQGNPFATFRDLLDIVLDLQKGYAAKQICEYLVTSKSI